MKYRSRIDIVAQILNAAIGGDTRTKIMYKSYLSHTQLKDYLVMLLQDGLIEADPDINRYRTTEKGMKFVQVYEHIGEFIVQEASIKRRFR
jgi:predicted transcriptional regulator